MVTKVLFVASSGVHLEEISQLKRIAGEFDNALVTEKWIRGKKFRKQAVLCSADKSQGAVVSSQIYRAVF